MSGRSSKADTAASVLEDLPDVPLPTYIDALADRDPDRPFAEVLIANESSYTSKMVTVGHLANGIDEAARWLDEKFGSDGPNVLAFMASAQDLRHLFFMLGAIKSRRLAFFPSRRNTAQSHCALFKEFKCSTILLPKKSPLLDIMKPVIDELGLQVVTIPGMHFFLSAPPKAYIWKPSDDVDFRLEPLVGLQTSGSTDIPRPVVVRHGFATAMDHWKRIPELGLGDIHFTHWTGKTIMLGLPLLDLAAIGVCMAALQNDFFLVIPPPASKSLSAELVSNILEHASVDVLITTPSILADMAGSLELLRSFSRVGGVAYGGGPLPSSSGDLIARQCHLLNLMISSEAGILPCELVRQLDWRYIKFSPVLGVKMRPRSGGLYEMVFARNEAYREYQTVFHTFPELDEYATNDLFSPHPTKPDIWLWQGRKDDIIVYSTGEKFNPTAMEDILNGSPHIKYALVHGEGRPYSSLLVEPSSRDRSPADFIDRIWPLVQQANDKNADHCRIMQHMIFVINREEPLPRTAKDTVQRKAAFEMYHQELDDLYNGVSQWSQQSRTDSPVDDSKLDAQMLVQQILDMVERSTGLDLSEVDDFFEAGMDSFSVARVLRSLRKLVGMHGDVREVDAQAIYEHPTALNLARYICNAEAPEDKVDIDYFMQELFEKYTSDLPITARLPVTYPLNRKVVVLTGSTSNFGTHLFNRLIRDQTVDHIICINRGKDAKAAQLRALEDRGLFLPSFEPEHKALTFLSGDFSKQYLGLDVEIYRALLEDVTHVLHNAWQVNFNLPLQHFESPHICGISQLIDFSARSKHGAILFFISSTMAVSNYVGNEQGARLVPEVCMDDWSAAPKEGYGQSKLVAERILAAAAAEADIPCAICRVSQLAGPVSGGGMWPKHEWLPSLVMSSKHMGCLPATLGSCDVVDWLPVDQAASIVVDFFNDAAEILDKAVGRAVVYHAVNPRTTTWDALLPAVQPYLGVSNVYPSFVWVEQLVKTGEQASEDHPAARLLSFYQGLVQSGMLAQMDTIESRKASKTLANMQPITPEMFGKWLRKWVERSPHVARSKSGRLVTIAET